MTHSCLTKKESLPEFFKDQVAHAMSRCSIQVSHEVEFYLVNLLLTYTHASNFHKQSETGEAQDKALALQLFDAVVASRRSKIPILKEMGDMALYTSGFFGDSLYKKAIDLNYYISMGHTAYASVSQLISDGTGKSLSELFYELATNFKYLVDVLATISESTNIHSDQNLLKIYERWAATGSHRLKTLLYQHGIIPEELNHGPH